MTVFSVITTPRVVVPFCLCNFSTNGCCVIGNYKKETGNYLRKFDYFLNLVSKNTIRVFFYFSRKLLLNVNVISKRPKFLHAAVMTLVLEYIILLIIG